MNFIKKYLAARARKRYVKEQEHIAYIAQIREARKNCEKGNHVWGRWERNCCNVFQHRDCSVCGFREEKGV